MSQTRNSTPNRKQSILQTVMVTGLIFSLATAAIVKRPDAISLSERRPLKQFPAISFKQIESGRWMQDFETYANEQFPLREWFRSLKAYTETDLFQNLSNNKVFYTEGHLGQLDYPLNPISVEHATDVLNSVIDRLTDENQVYYSIIPDKNYYLQDGGSILTYDYDELIELMQAGMHTGTYIDITDTLKLDDYYQTDIHWRQEKLMGTADRLLLAMGQSALPSVEEKQWSTDFLGVYAGRYAKRVPTERLLYLDAPSFSQMTVTDFDNGREIGIYQTGQTDDLDPYSFFLYGPLSLITIENPEATSDKELVIFRDSFSSAIAPLLTEAYSRVTLVDIRYMQSNLVERFIDFTDQDVLFLYSTPVLNDSSRLG